jgi:3-oxoacyl-[acyl-carrier-protein] synthase II
MTDSTNTTFYEFVNSNSMQVVITGIGIVSPIGPDCESYWQALRNGISGIGPIEGFDVTQYPCRIAGQAMDFNPLDFFPKRQLRRMDRFTQMGVAAAQMAWDDAGLDWANYDHQKAGICLGTGIGGIITCDEGLRSFYTESHGRGMDAFTIPKIMNNSASAHIAIRLGIKGINHTINTACSAGANAIGQAFEYIRNGKCEVILCGGAEAPITPGILQGWTLLKVLSRRNDDPVRACRPFDKARDGFVLAEGAAVLVLESLASALTRSNNIYAEIVGFGSNCDAYRLTAPSIEGEVDAMRLAIKDAGLNPEDIDYINAHGTATQINDQVETAAIKDMFGNYAFQLPISSTKSMIGHAMGASSALEFAATSLSVKHDLIPPTINYQVPDPECDLDYVPNQARPKEITHALSNSFGFGGSNAVLVVKKWKP